MTSSGRSVSEEHSRQLVYFAAESTLTSWVRTALSLMALGFVIDRFDLVLREVLAKPGTALVHSHALWHWSGSVAIGLGVLMAFSAAAYYLRFALRYRRDDPTEVGTSLMGGVLLTFLVCVCGLILIGLLSSTLR